MNARNHHQRGDILWFIGITFALEYLKDSVLGLSSFYYNTAMSEKSPNCLKHFCPISMSVFGHFKTMKDKFRELL